MSARRQTRLVAATLDHFDWAIAADERTRSSDGLRLPPGGLEPPAVLAWLKRTSQALSDASGAPAAWLMVDGDEAVGLVSLKAAPRDGGVEIGYGVAESRRARGHATRAVALVIAELGARGLDVLAETAVENHASRIVLERNGFVRRGERVDPEDGALVTWRRARGA